MGNVKWVAPVVVALLTWPAAAQEENAPLELNAFTEPSRQAEASCSRGGVIAKVLVEEGQRVKKGDVIVELTSDVERAQYEWSKAVLAAAEAKISAAEASVESAKATIALKEAVLQKYKKTRDLAEIEFKRAEELYEDGQGVLSKSDYEQAELNMRLAELDAQAGQLDIQLAQVGVRLRDLDVQQARDGQRISELSSKQYEALLGQMTIKAPVDGEILLLYKHEGEAVEEHAPLLKLVNVDRLDVTAFAPLSAAVRLRNGMQGTFVVEGLGGVGAACEVFLVDAVADPASGTFRLKARIDNSDRKVLAGVRGVLRLEEPDDSE